MLNFSSKCWYRGIQLGMGDSSETVTDYVTTSREAQVNS